MERWQSCSSALFRLLTSAFAQLRRAQPDAAEHDVTWHGPHWVRSSRRERWCPTRFSIYDGEQPARERSRAARVLLRVRAETVVGLRARPAAALPEARRLREAERPRRRRGGMAPSHQGAR